MKKKTNRHVLYYCECGLCNSTINKEDDYKQLASDISYSGEYFIMRSDHIARLTLLGNVTVIKASGNLFLASCSYDK